MKTIKFLCLIFAFFACILIGYLAKAQTVSADTVRLIPDTLPSTCNNGDLKVDSAASNAFKKCQSNAWATIAGLNTTDDLPEGVVNLYFTDERAQDAVGGILANGSDIHLIYSDATPSISSTLTNSGVTAGSYGSASSVGTFTVDVKGRLTAAANAAIAIASTAISDFTEAAQDAVGAMVDSTLVYVDGTPLLTRAALTGDITAAQGSNATTLATVNSNVGTFGSATQVGTFTVNGKGLVTAASNTTIAIPSTAVTDFTEAAQDATGAMVDSTLVYVDGTPLLTRAALTGDVTAAQSSNATTIANDAVTYAKMQNVSATSRVLGRITAGAGDVEELTGANIATIANSSFDHGTLTGLGDDDHTQYALLAGRSGGQTLIGGTASGNTLTLQSTSNATKGKIVLGTASAYNEVNDRLGIGTTTPSRKLHVLGDLLVTDISVLNGDLYGGISSGGIPWKWFYGAPGLETQLFEMDNTTILFGNGQEIVINDNFTFDRVGAGAAVFNASGLSTGDFQVQGDTDANLLFTDASTDRFGVGTNAPSNKFHVKSGTSIALGVFQQDTAWNGANYALSVSGYANLGGFRVNGADTSASFYLSAANMTFAVDSNQNYIFNEFTGAAFNEKMRFAATSGNLIIGSGGAAGTSAVNTFVIENGTAPTTSPANMVQIWTQDTVAGQSNLYARNENGKSEQLTGLADRVSTQFDMTTTTLTNITGLSHNVEASKAYAFEAILYTTSNVAGGIKAAIAGTATATSVIYESLVIQTGTTVATTASRGTALGNTVCNVTAVTAATCIIKGTIVVNAAGTLTAQFAANAAVGTSSVLVGSSWTLTPIGD